MKNHIVNFCIEKPNELEAGRINYEEESMEAYEEEGNSKEGKEEIANEEDVNKRKEVVISSDGEEGNKLKSIKILNMKKNDNKISEIYTIKKWYPLHRINI